MFDAEAAAMIPGLRELASETTQRLDGLCDHDLYWLHAAAEKRGGP